MKGPRKQAGEPDEMETFLKKPTIHTSRNIPTRAKKSLAVAVCLFVLGCVCLYLFFLSLITDIDLNGGRWFLCVFGCLSIPSAIYTFYIAWNAWNRVEGYYWPQIFF